MLTEIVNAGAPIAGSIVSLIGLYSVGGVLGVGFKSIRNGGTFSAGVSGAWDEIKPADRAEQHKETYLVRRAQ